MKKYFRTSTSHCLNHGSVCDRTHTSALLSKYQMGQVGECHWLG